ncbi:Protein kinase domain [Artemisia annua]|uniref:Protein kinase domain n=1 Tax=Artemisia annua TaxID=35608 RepID=A0A2U1Q489_ARTAN|nr:Protein kinase domain [Artemisia annua]
MLTDSIPQSLCDLLPNSMNFSDNLFSGPIPVPFIEAGFQGNFFREPKIVYSRKPKTEGMIDQNVVGHGGLGTVYRINLHNGEIVAVANQHKR